MCELFGSRGRQWPEYNGVSRTQGTGWMFQYVPSLTSLESDSRSGLVERLAVASERSMSRVLRM